MTRIETYYETRQKELMKEILDKYYENILSPMKHDPESEPLVKEIEDAFNCFKDKIDQLSPEKISGASQTLCTIFSRNLMEMAAIMKDDSLKKKILEHIEKYDLDDVELPEKTPIVLH